MEQQKFNIQGISCMNCVSKIEKSLYSNMAIKEVTINKENGLAILKGNSLPHIDIIKNLVHQAGEYNIKATFEASERSSKSTKSYKPLSIIVLYLLGITLLIEFSSGIFLIDTWMPNFMAGFFVVFSFFKMLDIPAFAKAYQSYDIIAAKSKWYGYAFPFIELGLGIAYILFSDNSLTHLITAIIMFVSLVGVVRSVVKKSEIQCACLGTVFNLPMSYVTVVEDSLMFVMALTMYLKII